MNKTEIQIRLAEDKPLFHAIDEDGARLATEAGVPVTAGDVSWSVSPGVLRWIADRVTPDMVTIETGAGYTSVVFAALAKHHYCCTYPPREEQKIREYLEQIGVPQSKVTFMLGSTDATLPALSPEVRVDFGYIDGCHGYPYPALDWHYIDKHLVVDGIVGMDNVELRPVREHCEFLEENGSYRLIDKVTEGYFVHFYRKVADEGREWIQQTYSKAKKDPCDNRLATRMRRNASRLIKPHLF